MAKTLDALVARVEARTGVQVATAIVGKADAYAELPWMAFALGAAVAALATVAADLLRPQWATEGMAALQAVAILGAGAVPALLAVFVPPFARLFLRPVRSEVEVRQYAESLFLRHRLFATRERRAVLLLVSRFERRIEVLADEGVASRVPTEAWEEVVGRMTPLLRRGQAEEALVEGVEATGAALAARGFSGRPEDANELPDRTIEEEGA
jgi:putative membrane protein